MLPRRSPQRPRCPASSPELEPRSSNSEQRRSPWSSRISVLALWTIRRLRADAWTPPPARRRAAPSWQLRPVFSCIARSPAPRAPRRHPPVERSALARGTGGVVRITCSRPGPTPTRRSAHRRRRRSPRGSRAPRRGRSASLRAPVMSSSQPGSSSYSARRRVEDRLVVGELVEHGALAAAVADRDPQRVEPGEHVELGDRQRREPVEAGRVAQRDQVEPAAAALAAGGRAELVAPVAQVGADLVGELGRERAGADPRRVRLADAPDLVDVGRARHRRRRRPRRRSGSTR